MKTLCAVLAVCALFVGFISPAFGQGTVTYTSLSASQLGDLESMSVWTLLLDVQHNGTAYLMTRTETNAYTSGLNIAYSASVLLSESGGTVTVTDEILNGRFGSTGATAGTSINSTDTLSGIIIAMTDAYTPADGGATIGDLYLGANYQPNVADTTRDSFSGILCTFSDPTSDFSAAFTLTQPEGSGEERIFIIGLSADPVPEPSSFALAGFGGLALYVAIKRRRK
jgi:hypothetical protein